MNLMRGYTSSLLTFFIISSIICVGFFQIDSLEAAGKTINVDANGSADYGTIQDAIDAANPGDVIYVSNGSYYENLIIDKPLSLIGKDENNTTLHGENREAMGYFSTIHHILPLNKTRSLIQTMGFLSARIVVIPRYFLTIL